jgi:superfamily II DNA or RNA helicase
VRLTIAQRVTVHQPPADFATELQSKLTLPNPEYTKAVKREAYVGHLDEHVRYYVWRGEDIVIPRGAVGLVLWLARRHGIRPQIDDQTRTLDPVEFTFNGELRPYQKLAVGDVTKYDCGTLQAPTGSGKTIMALGAIAQRAQPALVVVHNKTLADQWVKRAGTFLGIPAAEIGRIGGGEQTVGNRLTIAIINSLAKCARDVAPKVGHLVVDECHRVVASRYAKTIGAFDARYRLGLSATPYRRDGLTKVVSWIMGATVKVDKAPLVDSGAILPTEVDQRRTFFSTDLNGSKQYQQVLSELTECPNRNALIARDIVRATTDDRRLIVLVLSDRVAHCEALRDTLARCNVESVVLTGQVSTDARDVALAQVDGQRVRVVIGTAQLIGEGFDFPKFGTLFLTTPIKFSGRVVQVIGRVMRPSPGKSKAQIVDYVDQRVGVLRASGKARLRTYAAEGLAV